MPKIEKKEKQRSRIIGARFKTPQREVLKTSTVNLAGFPVIIEEADTPKA